MPKWAIFLGSLQCDRKECNQAVAFKSDFELNKVNRMQHKCVCDEQEHMKLVCLQI